MAGDDAVPEGIVPVYLTEKTLTRWGMKTGEGIADVVSHHRLEMPFVRKELEEQGFMCDLYDVRDRVKASKLETLLLVYDPESEYGQNFFWPGTAELDAEYTARLEAAAGGAGGDGADGAGGGEGGEAAEEDEGPEPEVDVETLRDRPIEPRPWRDLGGDADVRRQRVVPGRARLGLTLVRHRNDLRREYAFDDRDPPERIPEFGKHKMPGYELRRRTLSAGFQCAGATREGSTQTTYRRRVNKAVQSAAIALGEQERRRVLQSTELKVFVDRMGRRVEEELLKSAVNPFDNPLDGLQTDNDLTATSQESTFRGLHTFTHLKHSKGRVISSVAFHPTRAATVAFSCSSQLSFDDYVERSGEVLDSTVLLWSFRDVLQPEAILEVPGNVTCFEINPHRPSLIACGLQTGQVVLYDLDAAKQGEIKGGADKKKAAAAKKAVADKEAAEADAAAAAKKEGGAGDAAAEAKEDGADGKAGADGDAAAGKGAGAGADGGKAAKAGAGEAAGDALGGGGGGGGGGESGASSVPVVRPVHISYIDRSHSRPCAAIRWLPRGEVVTRKGEVVDPEEGGGSPDYSMQFMSVSGDGQVLIWDADVDEEEFHRQHPQLKDFWWLPRFALPLARSNGALVAACCVCLGGDRKLFLGDEYGKVVFAEYGKREEDGGSSSSAAARAVKSSMPAHTLPCASVERSPHFKDMYLSVGDWRFAVWREGLARPVFVSPPSSDYVTAAAFSPTRPGVILVSTAAGTLEAWDLLEDSHKEAISYSVAQAPLSSLQFWQSRTTSQQFVAVGDEEGNCHVLEVPRTLRRKLPNEDALVQQFYDREVRRHKEEESMGGSFGARPASAGAGGEGDADADGEGAQAAGAAGGKGGAAAGKGGEGALLPENDPDEVAYRSMLAEFQQQLCE